MSDLQNHVMVKLEARREPSSFEVAQFDKKAVPTRGIAFESHVCVEPVTEGTESKFLKRASLSFNLPGWSPWEVMVDEGTTGGGMDSAPSPLGYLSVGVASCLLTHLVAAIDLQKLDIRSLRVEQRIRFHSTFNFSPDIDPQDIVGRTLSLDTDVVIDSDESNEALERLVALSDQACFAANAFISQVPASTKLVRSGE